MAAGKGDRQRPAQITDEELARRWVETFGPATPPEKERPAQ